jgi:hypothetical protein
VVLELRRSSPLRTSNSSGAASLYLLSSSLLKSFRTVLEKVSPQKILFLREIHPGLWCSQTDAIFEKVQCENELNF